MNQPLLAVNNLTHLYAPDKGFRDVSLELWPGEVLGIVGESGSGKTTLLKAISARLTPQQGEVLYQQRSLYAMSEAERRRLLRTEWGVVHQHPMDGLRRQVSAGGNIGERLMATGARHYGNIRATAEKWLQEVEIPPSRIDDLPTTFSGGMQQRLQIARNLVTQPKLVFMDETHRRAGCVRAGAAARPAARPGGGAESGGGDCYPRSRRRSPAGEPSAGDEAGPGGGEWLNRPGARRSAPSLHPAAGVVGVAELMLFCRVAVAPYPAHRCVIRRPGKRSATRQLNPVRANMIRVENVHKTFVLHQQHGVRLPVLADASLTVNAGECVVLHGHSGSGKSTLLRSLYANYLPDSGHIHIRHGDEWVDLVTATPRKVLEVRKTTIGWVSQFLRVIPRISALEVVMQPLLDLGTPREASAAKAAQLLTRLNVPERLWHLAPSTFSGGEQQRVNIARGFAVDYPILLLDEPTASLDGKNSAAVVNLIHDAKARGAAIVGIFHDEGVRRQVADRLHSMGMTA